MGVGCVISRTVNGPRPASGHARVSTAKRARRDRVLHRDARGPGERSARPRSRPFAGRREGDASRAAVRHRRMGRVAGPLALRVDLARRRPRFPDAMAIDQEPVFPRPSIGAVAAEPRGAGRAGRVAAAVLGTSRSGRRGLRRPRAVLLDKPGEARPR